MVVEILTNRSVILRLLIEHALDYGSPHVRPFRSLLVTGLRGWKGRGRAGNKIASAAIDDVKILARDYIAARKGSIRTKAKLRRARSKISHAKLLLSHQSPDIEPRR